MGKALNVSLAVTADTSQAKAQLAQLQQSLSNLSTSSEGLRIGIDSSKIKEASNAALELGVHLKNATNDNGTLNFTRLNNSIQASGKSLSAYGQQLLSMGTQGQKAFSQLAVAVAKSEIPMQKISGLLGNFKTVIGNTIRWQLSSSLIHGFIGSISTAYNYAKNLNKSLTDIQIVTQASDQHMARFAERANQIAKTLSTTTNAYAKASLIYYQQGLSDKQVEERAKVTTKMANITGQTTETVSNQLTAIWNNFAKGGQNLEYYADVITALGAATASSSEEISKGLEKFASIADAVGLSYENATAALATITATTRQSADTVGTGLRTIFARLQNLKLGETLEDGVDLTKYTKALQSVGVNALDASGNLRDMDNILADMMNKWDGLSRAQKNALAQTVGGVRQYTTIMALMENSDFFKENLTTAKESEGTVAAQHAIYEKSWQASSDRLRASLETIYSAVLNDKFFIGLNNAFSKILDLVHQVNTSFGGLRGTLSLIGTLSMKLFSTQMTSQLYKFGLGVKELFTPYQKVAAERDKFLQDAAASALGFKNVKNGIVYNSDGKQDVVGTARHQAFSNYLSLQRNFSEKAPFMSGLDQLMAQQYLDTYENIRQQLEKSFEEQGQAQVNSQNALTNLKNAKFNGLGSTSALISRYNRNGANLKGMSRDDRDMIRLLQRENIIPSSGKVGNNWTKQWENNFDTRLNTILNKNYTDNGQGSLADLAKAKPIMDSFFKDATMGVDDLVKKLESAGFKKGDGGLIDSILGSNRNREEVKDIFSTFESTISRMSNKEIIDFGKMFNVDPAAIYEYIEAMSQVDKTAEQVAEAQEKIKKAFEDAQNAMKKQNQGMQIAGTVMNFGRSLTSIISLNTSMQTLVQNVNKLRLGGEEAEGAIGGMLANLGSSLVTASMGFGALQKALAGISGITAGVASGLSAIIMVGIVLGSIIAEVHDAMTESESELQERLAAGVMQSTEAARQSKQAFDELLSSFGEHNDLLTQINSLTAGTIEFRDKILEANEAARELIETYDLKENTDFTYDNNGAINFTQQGQNTAREKAFNTNQINIQNKQMAKILNNNETIKAFRNYSKDSQKLQNTMALWKDISLGIMGGGASTAGVAAATGIGLPVAIGAAILSVLGAVSYEIADYTGRKKQEQLYNNYNGLRQSLPEEAFNEDGSVDENIVLSSLGVLAPIKSAAEQAASASGKNGITWDEQAAIDYMISNLGYDQYDTIVNGTKVTNDKGEEIVDFNGKDDDYYNIGNMQEFAKDSLGEDWFSSLTEEQQKDKQFLKNAMLDHEAYKITKDLYTSTYNEEIAPFLQKYQIDEDLSKMRVSERNAFFENLQEEEKTRINEEARIAELTAARDNARDLYKTAVERRGQAESDKIWAEQRANSAKSQWQNVQNKPIQPFSVLSDFDFNLDNIGQPLSIEAEYALLQKYAPLLLDSNIYGTDAARRDFAQEMANQFAFAYSLDKAPIFTPKRSRAPSSLNIGAIQRAGNEIDDDWLSSFTTDAFGLSAIFKFISNPQEIYDYIETTEEAAKTEQTAEITAAKAEYDSAASAAEEAQATYENAQSEMETAQDQYDQAQAKLDSAQAQVDSEIEQSNSYISNFSDIFTQADVEATSNLARALMTHTAGNEVTMNVDLSIFDKNRIANMVDYFGTAMGPQFGTVVAKSLQESLYNGNENIYDFLSGTSLTSSKIKNNTIMRQRALEYDQKFGTDEYTKLYNEAFKSMGGEGALFEELYNSEDFADSLKSLQKTFKNTGKIGAASILDLAENSEMLQELLEGSEITAQGLASALEEISLGDINADEVSSGLLRALSVAGELEDTLGKVYSHIDEYNSERSVIDIGKFFGDRTKQIQESQGAGMLLDAPLIQSWKELFGNESAQEYIDDITSWTSAQTNGQNLTPDEITQRFNEKYADEIAMMQSIQERGNLSGVFDYYFNKQGNNGKAQVKDKNGKLVDLMHFDENTGQVVIDDEETFAEQFKSQKDFINFLKDNLDVPEKMAEAMAAEYAATNGWARQVWGKDSAQRGLEEIKASLESGEVFTMDQLNAFKNQYDEFLKLDNENWFQDLIDKAKEAGHAIVDLGDDFVYTNSTFEDLQKAMGKNNTMSLDDYLDQQGVKRSPNTETGEESYDVLAFSKALRKLGYTVEDANHVIDTSSKTLSATVRDTENGGYKKIDETDEDYQNWLKQEGRGASNAENLLDYIDFQEQQALIAQQATANAQAWVAEITNGEHDITLNPIIDVEGALGGPYSVDVSANITGFSLDGMFSASGYNNAKGSKGFAGGKHSNGQYEGPAIVGELGEETWIHDGEVDIVGQNGREIIYVNQDDIILTHAQTQNVRGYKNGLNNNLPGFSVGYNKITWGNKKSNASADNAKTSKYEPERYHLITRQLKDLQREYDRLDKVKENAYGTNKLEAIQKEVDATNLLIEGQKALIRETEDYLKIDTNRLKDLLDKNEFQIDANGNLLNFEELQEKYRRAAEEEKDEHAQDVWKALNQYEETLDKMQEANVEMQNLLYQEMELRLEKITTKAELKIDFDEREIKLLDHYVKRIDDNIYKTAEVLALTEEKLGHINQKIEDTKEGINSIFSELSDSQGNKITKENGEDYTLKDWLALSNEQRDLLDINDKFGKQLEEYMDNLLDYIEELEEFKTKGVEEFSEAFSELNENVHSSIDLFDHYNQLLNSLKNITDLQGVKLSTEMRAVMKDINTAMFNNTQNNVDAERENYRRLRTNVADLQKKVTETTDETLKKQWQEQLKTAEEELRNSESNLLSLWETGLQQAKDMFETALEEAATSYEETIAGMYGTADELQNAWDQQKKNDEFYVKDYEKYYQISKLQRFITKDLNNAVRNSGKQSQGLKKLFDELNNARENGVELSSYDLDIFSKRYEYEKALMELEDARNNKNEVRLQRDANGNWGYVYTSGEDEDDLIAKQQAVDDKFYELQKATQERVASLSNDMIDEITGVGRRLQELRSSGASQETIDKYLEQERKYLENYRKGLNKALEDAGMTEEEARLRYGNEGFDILDKFGETLLSQITGGNETLEDFFARVGLAMDGTNKNMEQAGQEYENNMKSINDWFNESGEDLTTVIKGFASVISENSDNNLIDSKEQIQNAKDTFEEILKVATDFESEFIEIYQPIIDENERLVADLLTALHALNREEYKNITKNNSNSTSIKDIIATPLENQATVTSVKKEEDKSYKPCYHKWQETPGSHQEGMYYVHVQKCAYCGATQTFKTLYSLFGPQPAIMASGGYTGSWGSEGRLAVLHEKELILNKDDTKNFLDATNILRTIDLQTNMFSKGLGNIITPWISDMKSQELDQNVHIEASFPNVTEHSEIELAFDNLINKASQYANRKNMSSMTFQDMYTSKF